MSFTTKLKLIKYGQMVVIVLLGIMSLSNIILADGGDFGSNAFNWLKEQIFWLALIVIAGLSVPLIAKKMWMQLVGFVVLASIVLVVVDDPAKLKSLGTVIWTKVFGA